MGALKLARQHRFFLFVKTLHTRVGSASSVAEEYEGFQRVSQGVSQGDNAAPEVPGRIDHRSDWIRSGDFGKVLYRG